MQKDNSDFFVKSLGTPRFDSPLLVYEDMGFRFHSDEERILLDPTLENFIKYRENSLVPPSFERAGPRKSIYFNPQNTRVAILTAGGLSPGLNDVIRALVMELYYRYRVDKIYGIRYGFQGFLKEAHIKPLLLDPQIVEKIHTEGGTILGSSRGYIPSEAILTRLLELNIDILFTIGGDGTLRASLDLAELIEKNGYPISVVSVPKTIDNDISYIEKTFGYETAFSLAVSSISGAHVEAKGAYNGIGLVKLMGRHSGYIASSAALAHNDANFVLIPEVPFDMPGENGFLSHLEKRLKARGHAVIVVAEGAGQEFFIEEHQKDASGNVKLFDIGRYMYDEIKKHFKSINMDMTVKYFDPSYLIRSLPATPSDSIFCADLARCAVHAGMAGKTSMVVGMWNTIMTNVPIQLAISRRKTVDPYGNLWLSVIEATGQPLNMKNP